MAVGRDDPAAFIMPVEAVAADPEGEEESLHVGVVAYAKAASARAGFERWIGASAAIASSIVTLAIFSSLSASPNVVAKVVAGVISAAAAALVALEKFSGKASSALLLKRSGEFAKLWYKLRIEGEDAFEAVAYQHAELIGTEPAAGEKYWVAAREQIAKAPPGA